MQRLDFNTALERAKNRAMRATLSEVFRMIDAEAERVDSALGVAWVETFQGRWTPEYLRAD